jgi:hypothetical protein
MGEEQLSFSSYEMEDSSRRLHPPSDHENNLKYGNNESSKAQLQNQE